MSDEEGCEMSDNKGKTTVGTAAKVPARITDAQAAQLQRLAVTLREGAATKGGSLGHIEGALGAVVTSYVFGWEAVKVCTEPSIWRRHRELLGGRIEDIAPAVTDASDLVMGYRLLLKARSFRRLIRSPEYSVRDGCQIEPSD